MATIWNMFAMHNSEKHCYYTFQVNIMFFNHIHTYPKMFSFSFWLAYEIHMN